MRRWSAVGCALALALVAGACSDDGDDASTSVAATATTGATTEASAATTAASTAAPTTQEAAASTSEATIATVPDEGVPGIDSDDPFCRAWSEFAGSFQALTLVASFGDPATAARFEVVASGAVTTAVAGLAAEFPAEVRSEQAVFLDELIGPFARRAERAVDELDAAGATAAQIDALGDAWLAALAESGIDDPAITVVVADDLESPLGDAVVVFAANVPPIPADPSLITEAQAPATLAYLAENCPDQGILAGNDVIDG